MAQAIIFKQDNGLVSIIFPTQEALDAFGIEVIAQKDVPTGKPYKILEINADNFPLDGTFNEFGIPNMDKTQRLGWTVDDAELTDGVGA